MTEVTVDIGTDFSRYPAGRFPTDGKFNGQTFREKFLVTPLSAEKKLVIALDHALDFGSSFLEEAFGGLIRVEGFDLVSLKDSLEFQTTKHPFIPAEIWGYIEDEANAICQ